MTIYEKSTNKTVILATFIFFGTSIKLYETRSDKTVKTHPSIQEKLAPAEKYKLNQEKNEEVNLSATTVDDGLNI